MKTSEQWSYEFAQVQMNDPSVRGQMLPHPQTVAFFERIQSDAEQEGFKRGKAHFKHLIVDNLEEVKNDIGGVIGYRLQLSAEEVRKLFEEIEK